MDQNQGHVLYFNVTPKANVHFMTLSREYQHAVPLRDNLSSRGPAAHYVITGAKGITAGYNECARRAPTVIPFYCFIHEDARLHFDWNTIIPEYFNQLPNAGVLGFVGCRRMSCDSRWWVNQPRFGSLIQGGYPEQDPPNLCFDKPTQGHEGMKYEPVDAVDGYCLFIRREVFQVVGGFDERFDAWHCYDADLCLSCIQHGFQNYVIDQKSQHHSGGSLADPWARENAKFQDKWRTFLAAR